MFAEVRRTVQQFSRRDVLKRSAAGAVAMALGNLALPRDVLAAPPRESNDHDSGDKYVTCFYQFNAKAIDALAKSDALPNGKQYLHIFTHSSPGIAAHPDLAKMCHARGPSFRYGMPLDLHKYKDWGKVPESQVKEWCRQLRGFALDRAEPADYFAFNEMPTKGFQNPHVQARCALFCRYLNDPGDGGPKLPGIFYFTEQNVEDQHWKSLTDEFWQTIDETCDLVVGEHYHNWAFTFQPIEKLTKHLFAICDDLAASGKAPQVNIAKNKYAVLHSSYYGPKDTGWHGPLNTEKQPADLVEYFQRTVDATRASPFGKLRISYGPLANRDLDERLFAPLAQVLAKDAREQVKLK
jgi:hypothetical protein